MERKYVGADCPACNKKGTVFRCPRRNEDIIDDYICVNCTLCNEGGCSSFTMFKDKIRWEDVPEISKDLYILIVDLLEKESNLLELKNMLKFVSNLEERNK